jgi:ribosomal protein S18 acetylase RimI-like enzyme
MSASSDAELLRRLIEFELKLERESSETVERFDWGRLIVNSETSAIWRDNFLEVDAPEADPDRLIAIADDLLAGRGLFHRLVVPADPDHGDSLAPRFRELGWQVDRSLYMVFNGEPGGRKSSAAEVSRAEAESVRRAVAEADPDFTREAVDQRMIRDERLDRTASGRWFAAPAKGTPGAACVLYEEDGIGQVETVGTAPEQRGRGLASAVVLAAVDASRRAGHELTFIVADADDWPWKLYERLGFDRVGEHHAFLRTPGQALGEESP